MREYFVDTNLFLRYLTNDVPEQAEAVEEVLRRARNEELLLRTSVLVIAEVVGTLDAYYRLSREDIRDKVLAILITPGLAVEKLDMVALAVNHYADLNVDFIDAYNALWTKSHGLESVVTFDTKHFSRLPGVKAINPKDV